MLHSIIYDFAKRTSNKLKESQAEKTWTPIGTDHCHQFGKIYATGNIKILFPQKKNIKIFKWMILSRT